VFVAPREPPTSLLAICNAALLPHICLLARQARQNTWEKLDAHGPHALCHDEARDLHRFGSYVTGHLPRTHPLVENETLDDRALEGVWLGIDLSTPMFWMYSFKCEQWYVSVIPVISTTFCLSYVRRISLTVLTSLPMTSARCTRKMA
jgi:hypothetical protein